MTGGAVKYCDLKSIRQYADILRRRDMPGTADHLRDMAAEIDALRIERRALRAGLTKAIRLLNREEHDHDGAIVVSLRALLPTKEPTNAE